MVIGRSGVQLQFREFVLPGIEISSPVASRFSSAKDQFNLVDQNCQRLYRRATLTNEARWVGKIEITHDSTEYTFQNSSI